ncbi:MAG: hypothetical protein WC322_03530 [Candidatus Paceibacterota bacterium]|jgi:hypothetical protein|nr:hypothetical protein [Candidatus Paceibacterota bacterium]
MQEITKFFQSKLFQGILIGIGIFLIFLFVFKVGMVVGAKKAEFSGDWSDNYHRNFAGPKGGFLNNFQDRDFMEANGVFGQIINIEDANIIVKGKNNIEKVVLFEEGTTTIKKFQKDLSLADLNTNDSVVIIGEPNSEGQIQARLIRVMPPIPQSQHPQKNPILAPPLK